VSATTLPVPRLVPTDAEALERRARALAGGDADEAARDVGLLRLVAFRLHGRPCAVDAGVVERAVSRLSRPISVPLADATERTVAFVEERPLPVVDLVGLAAGAPRRTAALEGCPALVLATPVGPVAAVVEGPLELDEDRVVAAVQGDDGSDLRVAGVLAGGAALLDGAWLAAWVGKAARP
jgi:hypothetical protein